MRVCFSGNMHGSLSNNPIFHLTLRQAIICFKILPFPIHRATLSCDSAPDQTARWSWERRLRKPNVSCVRSVAVPSGESRWDLVKFLHTHTHIYWSERWVYWSRIGSVWFVYCMWCLCYSFTVYDLRLNCFYFLWHLCLGFSIAVSGVEWTTTHLLIVIRLKNGWPSVLTTPKLPTTSVHTPKM